MLRPRARRPRCRRFARAGPVRFHVHRADGAARRAQSPASNRAAPRRLSGASTGMGRQSTLSKTSCSPSRASSTSHGPGERAAFAHPRGRDAGHVAQAAPGPHVLHPLAGRGRHATNAAGEPRPAGRHHAVARCGPPRACLAAPTRWAVLLCRRSRRLEEAQGGAADGRRRKGAHGSVAQPGRPRSRFRRSASSPCWRMCCRRNNRCTTSWSQVQWRARLRFSRAHAPRADAVKGSDDNARAVRCAGPTTGASRLMMAPGVGCVPKSSGRRWSAAAVAVLHAVCGR